MFIKQNDDGVDHGSNSDNFGAVNADEDAIGATPTVATWSSSEIDGRAQTAPAAKTRHLAGEKKIASKDKDIGVEKGRHQHEAANGAAPVPSRSETARKSTPIILNREERQKRIRMHTPRIHPRWEHDEESPYFRPLSAQWMDVVLHPPERPAHRPVNHREAMGFWWLNDAYGCFKSGEPRQRALTSQRTASSPKRKGKTPRAMTARPRIRTKTVQSTELKVKPLAKSSRRAATTAVVRQRAIGDGDREKVSVSNAALKQKSGQQKKASKEKYGRKLYVPPSEIDRWRELQGASASSKPPFTLDGPRFDAPWAPYTQSRCDVAECIAVWWPFARKQYKAYPYDDAFVEEVANAFRHVAMAKSEDNRHSASSNSAKGEKSFGKEDCERQQKHETGEREGSEKKIQDQQRVTERLVENMQVHLTGRRKMPFASHFSSKHVQKMMYDMQLRDHLRRRRHITYAYRTSLLKEIDADKRAKLKVHHEVALRFRQRKLRALRRSRLEEAISSLVCLDRKRTLFVHRLKIETSSASQRKLKRVIGRLGREEAAFYEDIRKQEKRRNKEDSDGGTKAAEEAIDHVRTRVSDIISDRRALLRKEAARTQRITAFERDMSTIHFRRHKNRSKSRVSFGSTRPRTVGSRSVSN